MDLGLLDDIAETADVGTRQGGREGGREGYMYIDGARGR